MTDAEQADLDEEVGRGLVVALFFVGEQLNRWPKLEDIRQIHQLIFAEAHPAIGGEYRSDTYWSGLREFITGWSAFILFRTETAARGEP